MLSSHLGQVLQRRFLLVAHDAATRVSRHKIETKFHLGVIDSPISIAKISRSMTDTVLNFLLLAGGLSCWVFCASPMLKYMVYAAERDFRWSLLFWFALMTVGIFTLKISCFALLGWPEPGSWTSRFFYPFFLFASYVIPFFMEAMRGRKR